ncbi:uncharacterized protein N7503_004606 [Penicillium pulvis]|uniref:uncharacterized protein n=1 Tax=Penicillium pulvis TaxID=1562058 RepID=UPI0025473845|nr:uncharacterized protein N7503_004606 [Penicillium pulvis]KAJ5802156.1 hypothetical protein N7503_004606 [Penicillium pulvis]
MPYPLPLKSWQSQLLDGYERAKDFPTAKTPQTSPQLRWRGSVQLIWGACVAAETKLELGILDVQFRRRACLYPP